MRSAAREVAFAVLAWFVPFATSVCIFPLKQLHRPLFESLMGLVVAATTVVLALAYLRRTAAEGVILRAARIGVTWMIANWAFDMLMFSGGPMQMTLRQYIMEIATAYLVIPVITIGLGTSARFGRSQRNSRT